MIASNASHSMTLFVGRVSGSNTGSTITLGNLNFTQTVLGNTSQTLAVTGADSYRLQLNKVNLPGLVASSTTWNGTLAPTTAPLTIAGDVQQAAGNAAGVITLTLDGTASGNLINGSILDSLDVSPKPLKVTKSNSSVWTLSGANAYTGTTTVSGGKLFVNGDQTTASGAVSVSANATLGGTGFIGGNTTIANTGKLEFNLGTNAASHNKLELASGKTLIFSGASTLTITSSGGVPSGDYTLVTAPGGFGASVPPATVILPVGWIAAAPRFVGTDLKINITYTGFVINPYGDWADNYPGLTNSAAALDFDKGGLATGIEWVVGGNPSIGTDDAGLAPTIDRSNPDDKLRFIFRRTTAAKNDANTLIAAQYGSNLAGWTNAVHQGTGPGQITITEAPGDPGVEIVTVALPEDLAGGGSLFVRLNVAVAE